MEGSMDLSGSELLIVLLIVVVLFGAAKLPQLGRNLGQGIKEFRRGLTDASDQDGAGQGGAPATDRGGTTHKGGLQP